MDQKIWDYYSEKSVQDILYLSEERITWEEAKAKAENLPRGWYELSYLSQEERCEFTRDFWLAHLPYSPRSFKGIVSFLEGLVDVGIFLLLKDNQYIPEFVYSVKDGFFLGSPPAVTDDVEELNFMLKKPMPQDFLSFLRIHNGFTKSYDRGILKTEEMVRIKTELEQFFEKSEKKIYSQKSPVTFSSLFPFYMSAYGRSYQCFYSDWYPEGGMGNVFLSLDDLTISPYKKGSFEETLAFPTFLDWLAFYLEGIQLEG